MRHIFVALTATFCLASCGVADQLDRSIVGQQPLSVEQQAEAWWNDQPDEARAMFCELLRSDKEGLIAMFSMEGNRDRVSPEVARARVEVMDVDCP